MTIIIIPGLIGHPEERTFQELEKVLISHGHQVIKVAWPFFPYELSRYNFTNTIEFVRNILKKIEDEGLVILGFSMGGIIATVLAAEFNPKKLGLIVSPFQAGTEDDMAGKYKEWKATGSRRLTSSIHGDLDIPFSFIEDAQRYNALAFIPRVNCPKLFLTGEADKKVPLVDSKKFFDSAKEPKEWCRIPKMEHRYQYQPGMLKPVNDIIVKFIESKS